VLLIVGVILGRIQNEARNAGRTDFVSNTLRGVVAPLANGLASGADGISNVGASIASVGPLRAENRALADRAQAAALYEERLDYVERELDHLHKLLSLPEYPGKTKVFASITGFFPGENRITLNVGKDKGLKPGMPVVAGVGLLGVVQTVDARTAQALLVSSPQLRIGAIVNRTPAPAGLIRGESASKMILEIVDTTATIEAGDLVTTSGHSELIPGGIPIGRVAEKNMMPEFGSVRCQVFPFVQIGDVRDVAVLR